jgi:hypothetical protein
MISSVPPTGGEAFGPRYRRVIYTAGGQWLRILVVNMIDPGPSVPNRGTFDPCAGYRQEPF